VYICVGMRFKLQHKLDRKLCYNLGKSKYFTLKAHENTNNNITFLIVFILTDSQISVRSLLRNTSAA